VKLMVTMRRLGITAACRRRSCRRYPAALIRGD
jgi:hypothetical protein